MKKILIGLILALGSSAYAGSLSGNDLATSIDSALTEASFEMDADSIFAWEGELDGDEIVVSVLDITDQKLTYGCHEHGPAIDCHEEDHEQGTEVFEKDAIATLDYMKQGFSAAVAKFTKTLKRRGLDFTAVEAAKTWTTAESHAGHGHEHEEEEGHEHSADVWTKFNYELNGQERQIYVQCHIEAGDTTFACHYSTVGEDEPELDGGHGHGGHGHGHGHGHSH